MDVGEAAILDAFIHNESDQDVFAFDFVPGWWGGPEFILDGVPHGVTYRMDLTYPSGYTVTEFSGAGGFILLEMDVGPGSEAGMYFLSVSTVGGVDCSEHYNLSVEWIGPW
jgi:hypothetical protein